MKNKTQYQFLILAGSFSDTAPLRKRPFLLCAVSVSDPETAFFADSQYQILNTSIDIAIGTCIFWAVQAERYGGSKHKTGLAGLKDANQ